MPDAGGGGSAAPEPVELQPCRDLLAHGVALAASRDFPAAEQALTTATERCPAAAAVWRELAGVRFLQRNWPDAARHAARAVDLAPSDELGWRILAAARYQQSDWSGALHAMRAAGEVSIDLIEVSGATRTPHPVVVETTGLSPGTPITAEAFDRAARRLNDLPVAMRSRLAYRPTDTGAMTVEAVIAERDGWPRRWTGWAAVTVRAAADRLLRIELGGLANSGELLTGLWRWSSRRPMGGFRLATPAPGRLPGVAMVEATWERQTYGLPAVDELTVASRRRVGFLLSDWASGSLRWEAEAAADRFDGRQHAAIGGALEFQGPADRLAVRAAAAGWGRPGSAPFSTASIDAAARLFGSRTDPSLSTQAGLAIASSGAPLALWPGAGTGEARSGRLRAHPLLADEVLAGEAFGRRLWHGTVEYAHPVFMHPAADVAVIGFADAARAWHGLADPGAPPIVHVDVGVGARISTPGLRGSLDVNVAYGTRDGRVAVSAGVRAPWPSLGHWRDR
jgi:hypothetical protein